MIAVGVSALLVFGASAPPSTPTLTVEQRAVGPSFQFEDREGIHRISFTFSDVPASPKSEEEGRGRKLYVLHDLHGKGKKARKIWEAKDFVLDCPFDITLELVDDSLRLTDVDGDGQLEISFAYVSSCRSDVSPDDMKLLIYEGTTKYALRGTRATFAGAVDEAGRRVPIGGGPPSIDPAFEKGPKALLEWAQKRWMELQPVD